MHLLVVPLAHLLPKKYNCLGYSTPLLPDTLISSPVHDGSRSGKSPMRQYEEEEQPMCSRRSKQSQNVITWKSRDGLSTSNTADTYRLTITTGFHYCIYYLYYWVFFYNHYKFPGFIDLSICLPIYLADYSHSCWHTYMPSCMPELPCMFSYLTACLPYCSNKYT